MKINKKKKIVYFINTDWFFVSHRIELACRAIVEGYEVHLICAAKKEINKIEACGIKVHNVNLSRRSSNLISDLKSIYKIYKILKKLKPDILHLVTVKPIIIGGILSKLLKIDNIVVAISGLGYLFIQDNLFTKIIKFLIKNLDLFSLRHQNKFVIVQNKDDRNIIKELSRYKIKNNSLILIPGSGVDLKKFRYSKESNKPIIILFVARLLKDKGINEFISVAKDFEDNELNVHFVIVGSIDKGNPSSIKKIEAEKWKKYKNIKWLGAIKDMSPIYESSNIVVLPSYREGMPKVLLEAAASGRAVITTNVPGCREAIINKKTGLLVKPKDSYDLKRKIKILINDNKKRKEMGRNGRLLAENKFDIKNINKEQIILYKKLINFNDENSNTK